MRQQYSTSTSETGIEIEVVAAKPDSAAASPSKDDYGVGLGDDDGGKENATKNKTMKKKMKKTDNNGNRNRKSTTTTTTNNSMNTNSKESPETSQITTKPSLSFCCRRVLIAVFLAIVASVGLVVWFVFFQHRHNPQPVASCGDCHCILDDRVTTCPTTTNYPPHFMGALQAQVPRNAYPVLSCDPYQNSSTTACAYQPPNNQLGTNAVCGIHYDNTVNCSTYQLKSYRNRTTAQAAGAFVTHLGECGACSTTQDLAVYMLYPNLNQLKAGCDRRAAINYADGVQCFQETMGFTAACADIWTDHSRFTSRECRVICLALQNTPPNGAPPTCALNDCLQCETTKSGPIFKQYAGRTRRNSGLLSSIAVNCSSIANIVHDTCPVTTALAG